jgi:hypothetical protein
MNDPAVETHTVYIWDLDRPDALFNLRSCLKAPFVQNEKEAIRGDRRLGRYAIVLRVHTENTQVNATLFNHYCADTIELASFLTKALENRVFAQGLIGVRIVGLSDAVAAVTASFDELTLQIFERIRFTEITSDPKEV